MPLRWTLPSVMAKAPVTQETLQGKCAQCVCSLVITEALNVFIPENTSTVCQEGSRAGDESRGERCPLTLVAAVGGSTVVMAALRGFCQGECRRQEAEVAEGAYARAKGPKSPRFEGCRAPTLRSCCTIRLHLLESSKANQWRHRNSAEGRDE